MAANLDEMTKEPEGEPPATEPVINPHDLTHHVAKGYPKLAGRMSWDPTLMIFGTFAALNERNLLYLQSEIFVLEKSS